MKNICVFCSSSNSLDESFFDEAKKLGELIGVNKFNLVYGGTKIGLMNTVAKTASQHKSRIIGVIPQMIFDNNIAANYLDELIVTSDMKERKQVFRDKSDAFITLPGGFGTMEELLELITLKQLAYIDSAIVIVNLNGFYDSLKQQFDNCFKCNFSKNEYRSLFAFVDNSQEAIDYIKSYKPQEYTHKWN